jgi:UDP-N-acetylglucosamine 3-dehydrogenase
MSKKLNVAVIGLGNMGRHHVRNYSEIEKVNLVAVCDANPKTAQEFAQKYNCHFYTNPDEMFQKEKIDAVTIAAPTVFHYEIAKKIIQQGLHVLIEKPIADTPAKADELINLAKKQNLILTVGHIERFNPAILKLKEIIKQNLLGKISTIKTRRLSPMPHQIKDANVMIDLAVHDIDICSYLLDKQPQQVYGTLEKTLLTDRADSANILLDYAGQSCFVEVNWITPLKIRTLCVTGSKGYAELDYIKQEIYLYESIYTETKDQNNLQTIVFNPSEKKAIEVKKTEPLKSEILHFLNCIENKTTPIVTGKMARDALEIALKF